MLLEALSDEACISSVAYRIPLARLRSRCDLAQAWQSKCANMCDVAAYQ